MPKGVWSGKEQMKPMYRYILLSGIAIWGTLMTISIFYTELRFLPDYFMDIIHIPAEILCELWSYLRLPPYGDAGIVIIPPIAFGLQWLIVFMAVFFVTRRKHKAKETNGKAKD